MFGGALDPKNRCRSGSLTIDGCKGTEAQWALQQRLSLRVCGAGAVTRGATTRVACTEKGLKGKAILRWAQNRIGPGETKNENGNRIGLSVGPNADLRLWSTGGEEARRDRGWVPACARTTEEGGRAIPSDEILRLRSEWRVGEWHGDCASNWTV